ncbi:MAG: tetratricopeptide repeat protein, partial [Deltaproteobacteria bacterium]|nr:tetratricopeptide repeat protein [Deltaproteobacteria bacterium]
MIQGASIGILLAFLAQSDPLPEREPFLDTPLPDLVNADTEETDVDTGVAEELQAAIIKLARDKNEQGKNLLKKYKYPEALAVFREAYELDSQNAEVVNNYGYAHALLGNFEDAEKFYEESIVLDPNRAVVYLNYSDLLVEFSPEDQKVLSNAAALLVKSRELLGNNPRVILRQARLEVLRGQLVAAERFYREYLAQHEPSEKIKVELGDFYRDMGRTEEAIRWYESVTDKKVKQLADGRLWEMEVEAQSVRLGWQGDRISAQSERLAKNAAKMFNAKKYMEAELLYRQVLKGAPTYAEAMSGYGDLLYRTGRVRAAETYWLKALVID